MNISTKDLLCLMFIYLKLTNQIEWNWIWVVSPFWIGIILASIIDTIKKKL